MALNLELLAELVAFQQYGTLSATAEHLMITQPSVTRGMRRLEADLGVTLFDRRVSNHITLNATGVLAATEAQKLLAASARFTETVLNYDNAQHEIPVASIAPGPTRFVDEIKFQLPAQLTLSHVNITADQVISTLQTFKARLVFTDTEIMTDEIESLYLGTESLGLGIDKFNPLAQRQAVTFNDLTGMSFLVVQAIGPWKKIVEDNIPDASFLYQADLSAMSQISRYSNFPFFFSNLTQATKATATRFDNDARNMVPIDDPQNKLEFYGAYLKRDRQTMRPLLQKISQLWPA
ncbi:LysR family transcriptional regulator [Levilactobacillus acidifarinae]|uniref:Probable hydrogen peroxide-inducible genes activator n=1 Tax=Levilactobacillus acidifarinae DSM 19394 = JCM 15949 TaxID=1423715 RepID=A0A0R1LJ13_9LACO|nr:LysR family transcriptional regulator [Levilactobacillus acidifarinae]KRK95948.1 transcriptional regulator, LysR family [Levilactobacillus acidifarinae DSM 19394]GEO69254.1 LysR family transcriptional regulator [Levilactobacillus acidifarinae]